MPTYTKAQSSLEPNNNGTGNGASSNNNSQPFPSANEVKPEDKKGASSDQSSLSSSSQSGDEMRQVSSNAEYDHIRCTTLMFFLDRLFIASKDGKEARTLHDLSCLFGTRDFTKEMRQIVGASRNGLRKFLQSYPSLFTIEGDKVYLTQLKQDSSVPLRDYNKEAVEYFTQKLLQFGASLVPIRNLFGYRSQASQEVRHVSGKNTREFRQFLGNHADVFEILNDEHVILKSALKELELRGETSQLKLQQVVSNDESTMDPYLNKQFAHLIEDCMKKMQDEPSGDDKSDSCNTGERVTLEYLHERIKRDCSNQLFLKMVETIEDLKVFLRTHPKLFKRFKCDQDQREYVSLLTEEEKLELKMQTYPSLYGAQRQNSTLKRCDTNESNVSDQQLFSLPPMTATTTAMTSQSTSGLINNSQQVYLSQQPASLIVNPPSGSRSQPREIAKESKLEDQDTRSITSTTSSQNNGHSSLRATAPPFVPSNQQQPKSLQPFNGPSSGSTQNQNQQTNTQKQSIKRSTSNLSNSITCTTNGPQNSSQKEPRAAINPRQALRSYLLKATTENTTNGLYSPTKHSNGAQYQQPQQQQQAPASPLSRQGSTLCNSDDLRTITVNIVREASNVISRIMNTADAVALDCNGYNLGFNGQITMIQLGFLPNSKVNRAGGLLNDFKDENENCSADGKPKPEVCVLDLITNPELAYCLKPLLESEQIVKIVHDVRNKSNLLFSQFGIMLNHVFDTQVANLVIQQQETGKPAYKSRYISMSRLCEIYGEEHLMNYRNRIKNRNSPGASSSVGKNKDSNYWQTRPLTRSMIYESTMDVYCLVGGVYQNLKSKIKPEYMPLFEQLNLEGVLARIKPDEIRSVKKERKIDLEVIDLKRKLYSDSTSAIVLSNREIRLLRHIDLTDEVRQKIQQCKKVAKKLERLDMKAQQSLQSMSSQLSMDVDQCAELNSPSLQTNGSNLSSSTSQLNTGDDRLLSERKLQLDISNGDLNDVTGMSNLMDSAMFDELKDKMIESSSLLESLDDDDDGIGGRDSNSTQMNSNGHHSDHENCRCHCHKGSSDLDKTNLSLKSVSSQSSSSYTSPTDNNKTDKENESKAVDMAIQCDLLS